MTLKIGFVTGEYPPMQGGVGAFTAALARAMAAAGHEVHVITSTQARPVVDAETETETGLIAALRRLDNAWEPIDIGYAQLHPRTRRWHWRDANVVADIAVRYELDVVNIQYQAAAFNLRHPAINFLPWRLRGICTRVVTFHDLREPYLLPKAGPLRRWAINFMARSADGVIATNEADFAVLPNRCDTTVRQIPIGSNIDAQPATAAGAAAARAEFGVPAGHTLFGYFGFLNATKGADTLLRALATLDERHHLLFIGGRTGASDPQNNQAFLNELEALISELGLDERVHWTDFVPDDKVSAYLAAADVMVMPYRDGVSLRRGTLMAALAHGRPLISTEPPIAVNALTHGENVWLVPPDDVTALAEAMTTVAGDAALQARLAAGALAVADLFTWDKIAAATLAFYGAVGAF